MFNNGAAIQLDRCCGLAMAWCLALALPASGLGASVNGIPAAAARGAVEETTAKPLTLEQAIAGALARNFTLQLAQSRLVERRGEAVHAGRLVPSEPQLELSTGRRDGAGRTSTDLGIHISQEFWLGGQGDLARRAARATANSAESQLEFLRTVIIARTRQAFLELLVAGEETQTAQRALALAGRVERYARSRLESGQGNRPALNAARIELARAKTVLVQAHGSRENARLALTKLLAMAPETPVRAVGRLSAEAQQMPAVDTLAQRALERRRDLAAAAEDVIAARESLRLSRRALVPNLSVFASYAREGEEDIASVGVSLPLPLTQRYGGTIQAAGARLRQARIEQDDLALGVRREVYAALADYRSARDQIEALSREALAGAEENVRLTQTAFQSGKVGAPAVTLAQVTLLAVRADYLAGLRNFVRAVTQLERATGGLVILSGADAGTPDRKNAEEKP